MYGAPGSLTALLSIKPVTKPAIFLSASETLSYFQAGQGRTRMKAAGRVGRRMYNVHPPVTRHSDTESPTEHSRLPRSQELPFPT